MYKEGRSFEQETENNSTVVETPKLKTLMSRFQNRLMRGAFLGTVAFLEACGGLSKEDIKKMPLNTVRQLAETPEAFASLPLIKVRAYAEKTSEKPTSFPYIIPRFDDDGDLEGFDTIEKETDVYRLHQASELSSQSIKGIVERHVYVDKSSWTGDEKTAFSTPIVFTPNHKYNILGQYRKIKKGKTTEYVLDIKSAEDVEGTPDTPEAEAGK